MKNLILILLLLTALNPDVWGQATAGDPSEDKVSLQFPNNPVSDIASFYEMLTKKRLIRDSKLEGSNLSIVVSEPMTREEAISLIESALLLNGYTLVPVDERTSKLLGSSKQPKNESVALYADPAKLPSGEQVVSFFMPFRYISSENALQVFSSYITVRPYGALVAAPNVNALIITENVPAIRRLIALKQVIDVPGARLTTEFFTLLRADATKVAETLQSVFQKQEGGSPTPATPAPPSGEAPAAANSAPPQGGEVTAPVVAKPDVKIVPDLRTNRLMIIAPEQDMPYIRQLIENLDIGVPFESPLERPLRFVSAGEVLPVLADLLAERSDSPNGGAGSSPSNVQSPSLSSGSTGGGESGSSMGGGSKPDKLRDPSQNTAPLSVVVGHARLIADRSSNKIIVIAPPESRAKAARVLDMLDQRPKQVYLATVIGQLTLGKGVDAGIRYPGSITGSMFIGGGNGGGAIPTTSGTNGSNGGGVDIVPGSGELMNTAINLAAGSLSGLSIYGVIADSIDVTVSALQSTNRFKVISRPVVYTANNKKAVISSGQQVPVPESSLTSSLAVGAQGASIASSINYKDVVLKLEVIPLINSKNEVTLTIAQQNDNVQETVQISDNQVPVIGTQELTTTVTVPNRHTVVLGGLITEEEREIKTGLPLLNDIPWVGEYLFGSKEKNVVRRELIIMIQPFIIEDRNELYEANYIERANSGLANDNLFEGKIPVMKALLPDEPAKKSAPVERKPFPAWQESSPARP